jgi:hypothetical protein
LDFTVNQTFYPRVWLNFFWQPWRLPSTPGWSGKRADTGRQKAEKAVFPGLPWLVFCFSIRLMQIEMFALCHSARFDGANLSLLGIFDTLGAKTFPTQISCCVLAKVRFELGEEGDHKLEIFLVNAYMRPVEADGKIVKFDQNLHIQIPNHRSSAHFHMWNLQDFSMEKAGDYFFELKLDGRTKGRIPFHLWQNSSPAG